MATTEIATFIIDELESKGIRYSADRNFIHVSCPFHSHSGRKLKLGFSIRSGGMNCLVCKKKGHWNEYAELKGLETFGDNDPRLMDFKSLHSAVEAMWEDENKTPASPDWIEPFTAPGWRGLPREFLVRIPSYVWFDAASNGDRILWPVYQGGRFMGCTAARLNREDHFVLPKTRNLTGFDGKRVLFPLDYPLVAKSKTVVLVEGQYDALRWLYYGIPTVSFVGTGGWDERKLMTLGVRGYKRIIVACDGDEAGQNTADDICQQADGIFDVRRLDFPLTKVRLSDGTVEDKMDPGNCPGKYIELVRRWLI